MIPKQIRNVDYGRMATVYENEQTGTWLVTFSDYNVNPRRTGGMITVTEDKALRLARRFIDGVEYRWDKEEGIRVDDQLNPRETC